MECRINRFELRGSIECCFIVGFVLRMKKEVKFMCVCCCWCMFLVEICMRMILDDVGVCNFKFNDYSFGLELYFLFC